MSKLATAGLESNNSETLASRRLWSLWDMIELDAAYLLRLVLTISHLERLIMDFPANVPSGAQATTDDITKTIQEYCDRLNLRVSSGSANYLRSATTTQELRSALENVRRNMHTELQGRKFFEPQEQYLKYYGQQKQFGPAVFDAFPSANDDIYEAGMCLALERPTACVLHLMRVLEAALAALAKTVGVTKQNNWGNYITEIKDELDDRAKTSGARSADEIFYAEAAANFDRLRRAYRNPTMHPEKTYSQERADEIMSAIKSFMTHLASKISE